MNEEQTAYRALTIALKNEQAIESHEDLCAERYGNIHKEMAQIKHSVAELKGIFKWAGGALFTLVVAAFGFLINQTIDSSKSIIANNHAMATAAAKIEILQQQNNDLRTRSVPPPR